MKRYVALLRGINVGGRIIKKDELVACFEGLRLENVRTVIQSGNVLFDAEESDSKKLVKNIEKALSGTFNYDAKAFVMTIESLRKTVDATPFKNDSPEEHSYVIFMAAGLEKEFVSEATGLEGEEVNAGSGVVYWKVRKGMTLKSTVGKLTNKSKYKLHLTNRNLNTLKKIISS